MIAVFTRWTVVGVALLVVIGAVSGGLYYLWDRHQERKALCEKKERQRRD